jgi:uncharacterized Tic20 family protein
MVLIFDMIEEKMGIVESLKSVVMTVLTVFLMAILIELVNILGVPVRLASWPPSVFDSLMVLAIFFTILANEKEKTKYDEDPYPYDQDKGEGLHDK